jgi:hypothetical protein
MFFFSNKIHPSHSNKKTASSYGEYINNKRYKQPKKFGICNECHKLCKKTNLIQCMSGYHIKKHKICPKCIQKINFCKSKKCFTYMCSKCKTCYDHCFFHKKNKIIL